MYYEVWLNTVNIKCSVQITLLILGCQKYTHTVYIYELYKYPFILHFAVQQEHYVRKCTLLVPAFPIYPFRHNTAIETEGDKCG